MKLWVKVIIGLVLGLLAGLAVYYGIDGGYDGPEDQRDTAAQGAAFVTKYIYPFGQAFLSLIKMLIVPLIVTTLIAGVTALGDPKRLGSLGVRTIALYGVTTIFAVTLGLIMGSLFQPGAGLDVSQASESAIEQVQSKQAAADAAGGPLERILGIIPENPVQAMAETDVLGIIFFSILMGVGILLVGKAADPVRKFFDAAAEIVMKVTILIMELAPYGVFALMTWVIATQGLGVMLNLGKLAIALYLACAIHIAVVYGGLIVKGILKLPAIQFFRGITDAQGVAFSTASSSATLPVTISNVSKNLGVEKSVAGSVLPLGATINMDGTAIYLGIIGLLGAQASGMALGLGAYLMIALTATLMSIGAAGIPSAGLILSIVVLEAIGVSSETALLVVAFILPFDRLLDMMRTLTNVTGDAAVACVVAKWEGALDEETFRHDAVL